MHIYKCQKTHLSTDLAETEQIPFTVFMLFRVQLLIYRYQNVTGKLIESSGRKEKLMKFCYKIITLYYKCITNIIMYVL